MEDLKKYTLLVVDDDETLRSLMEKDFVMRGFNVLTAHNGPSAFELVKSNRIDLVISDIRMPGGDGMSLLKQIKEHIPDMPAVIFVSGYSDVTEAAAISKGAKKLVAKPFDRKFLINCVFEQLGIMRRVS